MKHAFTLILVSVFLSCKAQSNTNKHTIFFGLGNNNSVSDVVSISDKSFLGEVSGQIRTGIRIYDNYELSIGAYFRNYPRISKFKGLSYNKFLGYSGAFGYEYRKPKSRWGLPIALEVLKFKRNLDSSLNDGAGTIYSDHYKAISFGPKIGVRYHLSDFFFLETEVELLYEHYIWEIDWVEKSTLEANTFSSFKFFGLSANITF